MTFAAYCVYHEHQATTRLRELEWMLQRLRVVREQRAEAARIFEELQGHIPTWQAGCTK